MHAKYLFSKQTIEVIILNMAENFNNAGLPDLAVPLDDPRKDPHGRSFKAVTFIRKEISN